MGKKNGKKPVEVKVAYVQLDQDRKMLSSGTNNVLFKASRRTFASTVADAFLGLSGTFQSFFVDLARLSGKVVVMSETDFNTMLKAVEEGGRVHIREVSSDRLMKSFTSGPDSRDGKKVTYQP